ncbi:hypothetical protein AOLI_G00267620 [Acnodon oligacanthus]
MCLWGDGLFHRRRTVLTAASDVQPPRAFGARGPAWAVFLSARLRSCVLVSASLRGKNAPSKVANFVGKGEIERPFFLTTLCHQK